MATEKCERPIEKNLHEKSHEQKLSSGQTQVHKESKTQAESKTQLSHGVHVQQHAAAQGMAMTSHGKKEKKIKEKKEKEKDPKEKKEKKEKKTENKKKPEKEKEKSKHKKSKDNGHDSE